MIDADVCFLNFSDLLSRNGMEVDGGVLGFAEGFRGMSQ